METRLTFHKGKFRLTTASTALKHNAYWNCVGAGIYETLNLREADAFRRFADANVEKILNRAFQAHYDLPRLPPLPFLDPHQRAGVEWILSRKRSYLAHAPGAGKTAQAIVAAVYARGEGQALFIVPPSLVSNWERELLKVTDWLGFWPAIGVVRAGAALDFAGWGADYLICSDTMMVKDRVYARLRAMKKKFIAVDEASRLKESTAERSLAFYGGRTKTETDDISYPGLYQDARHVVFLDGSPMPNRPMELWAPTYALHPQAIDCMTQDDFGYRYCGPRIVQRGQYTFDHSSHEAELKERLQRDFMHVVPESALSHPERRRSLLFTDQDVRSAEHKSWERRHLTRLLSEIESLGDDAGQGDIASARKVLGLSKIDWTAEYTRMRLKDKNESILLFAWHREVVEGLAEKLSKFNPMVVMGGTPAYTRELHFSSYQAKQKKLLIMNIVAGGRGHNLQATDRVIFAEYSWTDELNRQCEKRGSRRGSDKEFIRCEYVTVPGSMDEPVLSSIFTKQRRVERIIG